MDFAKVVQYDAAIEFELDGPGDFGPTGIFFSVISANAPGPKAKARQNQAQLMISNIGKISEKKLDVVVSLIEKNEGRTIEFLAACVTGWRWPKDAEWNGKKIDFTPEFVKEVLSADWVFEQVDAKVSDIGNFTKG